MSRSRAVLLLATVLAAGCRNDTGHGYTRHKRSDGTVVTVRTNEATGKAEMLTDAGWVPLVPPAKRPRLESDAIIDHMADPNPYTSPQARDCVERRGQYWVYTGDRCW